MFTRKNKFYLIILALAGCADHSNEEWIAKEKIPVYESVEGDLKFFLQPMEICQPGFEMMGKADIYTKIKCSSGEGWVIDENFEKLRMVSKTQPEKSN